MRKLVFLGIFLLSSCEQNIIYRGAKVSNNDYAFLKSNLNKSTITQEDVINRIGYPSIILSENNWIYLYQEVKKQSFLTPKILLSEVVRVTFDANSKLNNISKQKLPNNISIKLESDTTKIDDQDLTFLKQMYHNLYRIGQKQ